MNQPSYIKLFKSGELTERIKCLNAKLKSCSLCPRNCSVNRLKGEIGYCNAGRNLKVASAFPHYGEEQPLVCHYGSGTIFLSYCNIKCSFCQNYDISHHGEGKEITANDLANLMLGLQKNGCHNINFVTPTQYTPQIIAALPKTIEMGLTIPIVWNCGGYESLEVIKLLDGIIDIYMPDAKFSNRVYAKQYADAEDYFPVLKKIFAEMFRQVGVLETDQTGAAIRGLLIRHLVMPENVAGSKQILDFVATKLSTGNYINIMNQYRPCYRAVGDSVIGRVSTSNEYRDVITLAHMLDLSRGFR